MCWSGPWSRSVFINYSLCTSLDPGLGLFVNYSLCVGLGPGLGQCLLTIVYVLVWVLTWVLYIKLYTTGDPDLCLGLSSD